ncbi:microtubule-associated protein futsch-like [Penaeus monodon]|uniref:microtubule-associated protein futsch-like n=1 Tax=Penaeus monodon TaxID=6687 RepID=UPI0018A79249|nr:microtubule-associated protein futsch-like [Penaeus monodon]
MRLPSSTSSMLKFCGRGKKRESDVTSTGKAGGAGVRAGCAVKAINGTPTAQLTLSHAHALTKQGSTLTLEIDDSGEEPFGTSFRSTSTNSSTSASTSSTVVAANGHISSAKRKGDSGSCSERPTEVRTEDSTSHTEKSEDSETSVIILETHGADPNILRSDPEQGAASHDVTDTEASPPKAESDCSTQESKDAEKRFSRDSAETDEGDYAEIGSQTDTSTDTLVFDVSQNDLDATYTEESSRGASVEFDQATGAYIEYPNEASDDESLKRSQSEEDYSSLGENDSFFVNFEEELEKVEQQYPELEAKHLLSEGGEEQEEGVVWVCEVVEGSSTCFTIAEEVEEEENPVAQVGKLDSTMGQYYSSASGGDPSRGDASGSLPSSPRSSEGWRMSMASTATVASSATANSDDTLAKDMSELSSINSRLSYLDEAQDDVTVPSLNQNTDPDIVPKETPQPDQTRQTSIKDAIDELESIEQAAQTLLLKRQCSDDERATPVPGDASRSKQSGEKIFFSDQHLNTETYELKSGDSMTVDSTQNIYENSNKSEKYVGVDKPESSFSPENVHKNDRYTKEEKVSVIISEDKPPLPPTAGSQPPKVEVKRRWFSRSKEIQPYISRESYNNDKIFKELERLRRSFQESDLNDFLDTLENTAIPDDMDEAFLRQLLLDIREDVEGPPPLAEGGAQLTEDAEVIETEAATPVPDTEAVAEEAPRQTATGSKFEKVKERIMEMIKVRKKDKGKDGDDADALHLQKDDSLSNELLKDDSSRSETPQISRSITPQSLRPDTPDSKSSRPLTPDSSKGDESKKGFNIAEFLKKGSPKYLRKKYKERKNRKSDVLTTSESESEDAEGYRKDVKYSNNSSLSQKKTILTDSQSSLKGSNRSLTASQELKKEVRFDLNTDTQKKGGDESKDAKIEAAKPIIVDEKTKDSPRLSGPQMITCEAQQQETVILKEFEETTQEMENDYILNLPSTVEDINARAENLLPRLPERAKPPRRRKKLIPAPVEELSTDVQSETTSTTSVESVKETRAESLKVNAALKDESPPPLPPYDEVTELETCTPTYIQVVETTRHPEDIAEIVEEITESIEITERRVKAPTPPAVTTSSATVINEIIILNSEASASVASTTDSRSSDGLVDPIPVTSVATISVAPAPETAVVVMYPPRTLPLPVIQESLNEDQVSLPTPSEPTLSFSTVTSSATTPLEGDHNESFYDNANPFAEFQEEEEKTLSLQPETTETIVESESPTKATNVETEKKMDISETVELTNKENTNLEKTDLQKDILDSQIIEVTPQISETQVGEVTTEVIPCESFEEVTPGEMKVDDEKVFKAKPEAEPEAEPEAKPEAEPVAEPETLPETVPETVPEEKPEAESEAKSDVKPEAKPVTKAEDIPEVKAEETERLVTESSVVEETTESKSETTDKATEDRKDKQLTDSQQEACKSPELEKREIADIDALAALTAEMFKFANENESSKTRKQKEAFESAVITDRSDDTSDTATQKDTAVSEAPQAQTQDTSTATETKEMVTQTEQEASPRAKSVKEMAKSNTIAIQTDATRLVRMYEAASQTDTEYETDDLETESELEETASGRYDASKWLFRPTNDAKAMDPQMQELHKQQQMMIQELQQQSVMQQQKQKKAPEVPPRQFQQKMPMQVVEELKSVLAENGDDATRLKKTADPPPRWDSDLTWENALQELGLDESTLLNEIEQILGFGSLSSQSRTDSHSQNELTSPRPDPVARGHKLGKSRSEEAPLVPGRESSKGVWSPGRTDEKDSSGPSKIDVPDLPSFKDQPTVWSPSRGKTPPARGPNTRADYAGYSRRVTRDDEIDIKYLEGLFRSLFSPDQFERAGSASPSLGRKEYRKITYEGTLQKRPSQENVSAPRPEESFAWKDREIERTLKSPTSTLPKVQNPTVTLLQKKRDDPHSTSDGQIPGKRPEYLKGDDYGPAYKPEDKLYTIKREYESEDEEGSRRFAVLGPKKVHGVGPTTNDGVPTTLKSGVKSEHQGEWYRRMFDSLHKVKDDDHVIIKYKCPRARYGGYMSEPEGYDSDVGSSRYATLDRRRMHHFDADPMSSSLPRDYLADLDPFFRNTNRYIHQPGRIEDYVPGHSSLSEKEQKKNPEAEIKLEAKSQEPPPVSVNHRLGSQKMSMTHALKESGYESDSTLVFRKREDARRQPPDPRKTSQVYRQIQRGGDIPLTGLQKTAPAKPKEPLIGPLPFPYLAGAHQHAPRRPESPYKYESGEVNIHYRTPVRIEQKEAIPEEELARRQEEHMKKVYEQERRKKYLAELEDIERRRHTDNFTPLQKSPIPLNRYDDESSLGTLRGNRTPEPKQVAKALYNFTAQNKRELTFNKGDVIFIRRSIDKNWYEGELRGSVGIFPCNYVEIVPYDHMKTLTRKPTEGQARARFNFQAQTSMEMSLSKGELVVLTRRVDENWYEGRIGARKGIFPVSYVDTLVEPGPDRPLTPSSSPMPRPALPAANLLYNGASSYSSPYSTLGRPGSQNDSRPYNQSLTVNTQQEPVAYRALYNYKPQNDDELELLEGDVVLVMEKCDDGWFVGTSRRTGLFGTFPGNYVERI